jgi:transcriptional regulator with XRE-family HTH domain
MSYLKQNIRYLRNKKNLNQEEFGALLGLSRDNIASYERGIEPKLDVLARIGNLLHISLDDLILVDLSARQQAASGASLPLIEATPVAKAPVSLDEGFVRSADQRIVKQQVPLYNIAAAADLAGLYNNKENIIDYLYIPNMPKCDGAVYVTGESMYPRIKSGDMVAFQHTHDLSNGIFYGEMYLISFYIGNQDFTTVKFIQKSELGDAFLKIVSQNQSYGPKDIPLKSIRGLALIKASISINSMT